MSVSMDAGYFIAVDASITNDWHTIGAQDLNTGNELVNDAINGDVTIDPCVIMLPRT